MRLSKEPAADFAFRHRFGIAYGIMLISSLFLLPALNAGEQGDVSLYQGVADDVFKGLLPYRDRALEYPPYAIALFILPRFFGEANYLEVFMAFAFVTDWLIKFLLLALGLRYLKTARALLPLLLYSAAVPFLRYFLLQRYDLFPALICLAGIWLFCAHRHFLCGVAMAVGIGVKLYPVVFVPLLFVWAARQGKGAQLAAGLTTGFLPIVILSFYLPWWRFVEFQTARGLQVESLYASALWLAKLLGVAQLHWTLVKEKWREVQGPVASAMLPWAKLLWFGAVGISIVMALRVAARFSISKDESEAGTTGFYVSLVARLLLMPLLAFVGFSPVLSPQFMVWLMTLAALTSLSGNLTPVLLISVATLLTPLIYPSLFGDYGNGLGLLETSILLTRNSALIMAWAILLLESTRDWQRHAIDHSGRQFPIVELTNK